MTQKVGGLNEVSVLFVTSQREHFRMSRKFCFFLFISVELIKRLVANLCQLVLSHTGNR